jgi:N-methylhydantoinase A
VLPRSTAFSAEGMLTCDVVHSAQGARFVGAPFADQDFVALTADYERLEQRVMAQFAREGTEATAVTLQREVGVRYRRQAHTLTAEVDPGTLTLDSAGAIQDRFERRYVTVYGEGALLRGAGIELEAQLVSGVRSVPAPPLRPHELVDGDGSRAVTGSRPAYFAGRGFVDVPVLDGAAVRAGETIAGPAIIQRMGDSLVVPDGFRALVDKYLTIELRRSA